jgi:hypothetical protein
VIQIQPKKSQKNEKRRCGKAGIHELLTAFLLTAQSCAIKLGFATDYGGRFFTRFIQRKD